MHYSSQSFLRKNDKRGYYFKPTCPSNGERYQSDVQGRCVRSLMQFATVRAPASTKRLLMRLSICTNGDECGAIAEDIQHQLIDFIPGTEECLFDASPVVMRD